MATGIKNRNIFKWYPLSHMQQYIILCAKAQTELLWSVFVRCESSLFQTTSCFTTGPNLK